MKNKKHSPGYYHHLEFYNTIKSSYKLSGQTLPVEVLIELQKHRSINADYANLEIEFGRRMEGFSALVAIAGGLSVRIIASQFDGSSAETIAWIGVIVTFMAVIGSSAYLVYRNREHLGIIENEILNLEQQISAEVNLGLNPELKEEIGMESDLNGVSQINFY